MSNSFKKDFEYTTHFLSFIYFWNNHRSSFYYKSCSVSEIKTTFLVFNSRWILGHHPHPPPSPSWNQLTIACLTFCLLLTDRPTLGLPEYKLKVVNICKMHGTGGLEVLVLCAFWSISTICRNCKKKWWKSAITLSLGNVMTSKAQVRCKSIEATLLYQIIVLFLIW